ncbi:GntR family transcriptional regulator [Streptomyces clavuligerus]|uniref:RorA-like transcriptional regulator n=1 Tax=Streptomyces clavuligerus TaxID=1901 RepID=E2PYS0_STRCL|nr:GntR family transcriptional regulator [Streptomyces clavuligerus]ANW19028.1 GntR family transcriptional regulator [Streptomyces clavuligerus]AXU13609.1 GntR family transcriptional regulator [Streptomyces clavuligerus]EFG08251.1 RorA-like transcriptional regulator [Streptomyces clavuligerus]MBY6303572.1 GntR family transcriptional regulator [Streptomyces clavuligerus]QCS06393.1 GntR family transcriptional regulator [Streptomyces clavuligerus]
MAHTSEEIAAELRRRIHRAELRPGDRLPTMEALAEEHGVSRQTAREALNLLKREGLAEYRGGRTGTTVRERPTTRMVRSRGMERDSLGYYSGANVQHWRAVAGTRTEVGTRPVPGDIAAALGVEPGTPVVVRERLNGDPGTAAHRQLTDSWLHPDAVAALPVLAGETGPGGIYDRIEEWAGAPIAWEEEITAITPSPDETAALLLPPGVPLLRIIRTSTVTVAGRPLVAEVNDIRMSAELFSVRYPLTRQGDARWPVRPASADFYGQENP